MNRAWAWAVLACALMAGWAGLQPEQPVDPQAVNPEHAEPAVLRRGREAFERGDWAAAAEAYQRALEAGHYFPLVHFRLGFALHVTGRVKEALPHHLAGAQNTHPELRVDCLYNAACAYALLGDKGEALRHLQYAIDAGFKDTEQVRKDTDLESLRGDEAFGEMVAGIGTTPRLMEQLDGFVGTWERKNEDGSFGERLTIARPLKSSAALETVNETFAGTGWTGLLIPDARERAWMWVMADGIGTTFQYRGEWNRDGSVVFTGRAFAATGGGVFVRRTFTPDGKDAFWERVEACDDGVSWREHHRDKFTRVE